MVTKREDGSGGSGRRREPWRQSAQRHFDPAADEELTTALVFAIADAAGVSPAELKRPPLYEVVDAPALEATLFGPDVAGTSRRGQGTVEFEYADYRVTVDGDGWIQVFERADAPD